MIKTKYITENGKEFDDLRDAQVEERSLISKKDNPAQELMFEIMKLASFNGFDGEHCVRLLKDNSALWEAAYMDSNGNYYLIRDLGRGYINVDTMYILPKEGKEDELKELVKKHFGADEVSWGKKGDLDVLCIWWD